MLIENEFTVMAPPDEVYKLMLDPERVAPCLPGTEIIGRRDDGSFDGQMSLKLGPMKMKYKGTVAIAEQDAQARSATMLAKGVETRGQGTAQATMAMSVAPGDAGGSEIAVSTEIAVTGRVAQMGQSIMQDVSTRMIEDMASNIELLLNANSDGKQSASPAIQTPSEAQAEPPAPGPLGSDQREPSAPPGTAPPTGLRAEINLLSLFGTVLRARSTALLRLRPLLVACLALCAGEWFRRRCISRSAKH